MFRGIRVFIVLLFCSALYGQNANEVRAMNNYASFLNESIHGMLIAHRQFENYNQTVNEYVDLPHYKLNNYGNKDLPSNIFEDPERLFFVNTPTPIELYDSSLQEGRFLGAVADPINQHIKELMRVMTKVNRKRIDIADFIETTDLTKTENLQNVYKELEGVVEMYDRFYEVYKAVGLHLANIAAGYAEEQGTSDYQKAFLAFYNAVRIPIYKCREGEEITDQEVGLVTKTLAAMAKTSQDGFNKETKEIASNAAKLTSAIRDYKNKKPIPKEYELYGDYYFYYNIKFINHTNLYGNGFVRDYNAIAKEAQSSLVMEFPQLYKVVYPEKIDKEELSTLDDDKLIALLEKKIELNDQSDVVQNIPVQKETPQEPLTIGVPNIKKPPQPEEKEEPKEEVFDPVNYDRGVVVHKEKIFVSSSSFDLELYDHLIKDGDRVSINVNGEWKFKNISLEKESRTVTIEIVPGKSNYILVHADNTGYRPPNTVALAYMVNGERKEITLKTDLTNSQMVEISYNGN